MAVKVLKQQDQIHQECPAMTGSPFEFFGSWINKNPTSIADGKLFGFQTH